MRSWPLLCALSCLLLCLGLASVPQAAQAASRPTVSSVSPASGSVKGSIKVTIHGSGFPSKPSVKFGRATGRFVSRTSPSTLTVVTPAHAAGTLDVHVSGSPTTSRDRFTFVVPPVFSPRVTSVSSAGVALAWSNPSAGTYTGILIRRATGTRAASSAYGTPVGFLGTGRTSWTDASAATGGKYTYAIIAHDDHSHYSSAQSLAVGPAGPHQVTGIFARVHTNQIVFGWQNPSDADYAGLRLCRVAQGAAPFPPVTACPVITRGSTRTFTLSVQPGYYTFWLMPYDTAGRIGVGASVDRTVFGQDGPAGSVRQIGDNDATADPLPTAQINGVAWAQVVVGNTVYVGGDFTSARPAGSPAGSNEVARSYLLAYDLTTGVLDPNFTVGTDGQVLGMAASPDQHRLYIVGSFLTVGGVSHQHIAVINLNNNQVDNSFAPAVNNTVRSISATAGAVYVGGDFTAAHSGGATSALARSRLAKFSVYGVLDPNWAPSADTIVRAVLVTTDGSKVVVGGVLKTLNRVLVKGLGAVSASTGATLVWHANEVAYDYGKGAAENSGAGIYSLTTDGHGLVFASGYNYGTSGTGNYEGVIATNDINGSVVWLDNCHGDTYDTYAGTDAVYVVGHPHWCADDNGWNETGADGSHDRVFRRALAFTHPATGHLTGVDPLGRPQHTGTPSPSLLNWFPSLLQGSFTGQNQAAWSVSGSGNYVVLAGEFITANHHPQQGLVRYATRGSGIAPNDVGPRGRTDPNGNNDNRGGAFTPTATQTSSTTVTITIPGATDDDDINLGYVLIRDGDTAHPLTSTGIASPWWAPPTVTFTDTIQSGTHQYQVLARDGNSNSLLSPAVTFIGP